MWPAHRKPDGSSSLTVQLTVHPIQSQFEVPSGLKVDSDWISVWSGLVFKTLVKITPIFVNITHQSKNKKNDPVETKMPLFFFLSNTYNLSFPFPPHLQLLLFYFIYRTTSHIFSSSTSLSSFDAQNENLIFPSKTLENFSFILSSSVSFGILGKIVILFFQVISYCIFKHEGNNKFIEKW